MWWDGLTQEEIRERLLKEGIFTPLIKAANLDQELLERAHQEAALRPEEEIELMREAGELWLAWMDHLMRPDTGK
jgi:hypothetical protein